MPSQLPPPSRATRKGFQPRARCQIQGQYSLLCAYALSNKHSDVSQQPTTALESAVDTLLKSAKMREQDLAQTESLKMNHLSVEEVAERRAELAKMRDLMFRAEAKAKRVSKIKSKTYRRIRKKAKAKLASQLGMDAFVFTLLF